MICIPITPRRAMRTSMRPRRTGVRCSPVQHHHAHMASCMAEHGLNEPVIGVTFDGTGYGTDGAIWGGEFLVGDYRQFRRAAHLRYVGMPGGDQAIREPWRMAAGSSARCGRDRSALRQRSFRPGALAIVERMLERRLQHALDLQCRPAVRCRGCPGRRARPRQLRRAGRDRAGMAGDRTSPRMAPIRSTWMRDAGRPRIVVDTRPLDSRRRRRMCDRALRHAIMARRFHSTMVEMIAAVCAQLRRTTGLDAVVLSGGVFHERPADRARLSTAIAGRWLSRLSPSPGAAQRRRPEPGTTGGRGGSTARQRSQARRRLPMCLGIPGKGGRDLPRARRAHGQGRFRRRLQARLPGARPGGRSSAITSWSTSASPCRASTKPRPSASSSSSTR